MSRKTFILSLLVWLAFFGLFFFCLFLSFYIRTFSSFAFFFLLILLGFLVFALIYSYFVIHIKRLHDLGHSGWWSLLLFLLHLTGLVLFAVIYLAIRKGSLESNRFGESPLADKKPS